MTFAIFLKCSPVYANPVSTFWQFNWLCAHKSIDSQAVSEVSSWYETTFQIFLGTPILESQMELPTSAAAPHFWLLKETERSPSGENSPSSLPQCPPWVLTLGLTHLVTHQELSPLLYHHLHHCSHHDLDSSYFYCGDNIVYPRLCAPTGHLQSPPLHIIIYGHNHTYYHCDWWW